MQALILAGGKGTRLAPVIGETPKVMVDIGGKPFLTYLLEQLKRQGIRDICLAVGYQWRAIRDYYQDGTNLGLTLRYSIESEPLGTGGAIKKAAAQLSQVFLVLNGDSYVEIDFRALIKFHQSMGAAVSLAVTECHYPDRYGVVTVARDGRITSFSEKPRSTGPATINAGVYVINREFAEAMPDGIPLSFEKEVLPQRTSAGLFALKVDGFFVDIGTPAFYEAMRKGFRKEVMK